MEEEPKKQNLRTLIKRYRVEIVFAIIYIVMVIGLLVYFGKNGVAP